MNSVKALGKSCWRARTKSAVQLLGGVFAVLLLCVPAFSQGSFGRILGTVTDQSGGVVSGATVSVIDTARGITRTLTTDDVGAYNAPNLTAGNYTVRAEAKGFKRTERQGIVIEIGKEVRIDLSVQPGDVNQTVTVTESVPLVETTNASLTSTLENSDIVDLPLNGRDYQNLLGLRPGVMLQPGGGPWTQSTNGVRPDESVWLVEGIINENFFDGRPVINMPSPFTDGATILPVDAIQEFNLQENPKAEYGWKAGAIVNVGIKSGTNAFHGDAYAFGRYQDWDARNFFNVADPASGCALVTAGACNKTPANLKQFGGVVGGPIKKDKLFFFGGYEGLRSFIGFVGGIPVPATAAEPVPSTPNCPSGVTGDCAGSMVNALQALNALGIPASAVSLKLAGCTAGASPVCTGVDNGSQLFPVNSNGGFLSTFPTINTSDNGVGKLDFHPNDKNSFNGMFFYGHYNSTGEDHAFVSHNATDNAPIRATSITASWVYTPSSNLVNEARFGYDRTSFDFINIDVGATANSAYGVNTGVTSSLAGGLPSIVINGFGNGGTPVVGTAFNRPQYFTPNPYWDAQDSVSILKGKHSIKIGGEFAHIEADAAVFNNGRGKFNFFGGGASPSITVPCPVTTPPTPPPCTVASSPLEDFFAAALSGPPGSPAATLLSGQPQSKLTEFNYSGYIQDDWRVTPKVIVNLGLRYTFFTPFKDAFNNIGNFDPASPTGMVQQGQPGYGTIWKPDASGFEPRFGMAWDVKGNGTTVARLGIGLIHETWTLETFEGQFIMQGDGSTAINAIPTGASIQCGIQNLLPITCPGSGGGTNNLGSAGFSSGQLCWDPTVPSTVAIPNGCTGSATQTVLPTGTGGPKCGDGVTSTNPVTLVVTTAASPCDLMSVNPNLKMPFVLNYNLGVTHAFGSNLSLEVEYVGNHGYRLLSFTDINQAPLGAAYCTNTLTAAQMADACNGGTGSKIQEARPYFNKFPYLGYIYQVGNSAYSNYNSLQVTVTKRLSHGLLFNIGYTYGHGLDNGSLNRFGLNPENSNNLAQDYAASDFDVRHRLTATATYNIPGIKGFGQALEGWQINTIVTFATAQPWQTFDAGDNFSGTGENTDRWSIFGNPSDFPSGKNSIPYCNGFTDPGNVSNAANGAGATCGFATALNPGANAAPFSSSAGIASCVANANATGAAANLASTGCYVSRTGNASVIIPPANGTYGNMGRNILRDNGFKDWDLSIFKNFTFKERYGIQARWEVFNVLNHPIAANPSGASSAVNTGNSPGKGNVFGGSFLTPDFAAGNPLIGSGSERVMQVGLKLTF